MGRSIGTLLVGTLGAQAIAFFAIPLLTRIYDPDAFGNFQIHYSIFMLLAIVVSLRYELAILTTTRDADVAALLLLCLAATVGVTSIVAVVVSVLAAYGVGPFGRVDFLVWSIPIGALFGGVFQFIGYVPIRRSSFGVTATMRVLQTATYAVAAVAIGLAYRSVTGVVLADIVSRAVVATLLLGWLFRTLELHEPLRALPARAWQLAVENRRFAIFSSPGALLNSIAGNMAPVAIFTFYGSVQAGHYALVDRAMMAPAAVLAMAASQAFTAELSRRIRAGDKNIRPFFRKTMVSAALLAAIPTFTIALWAEPIFGFVFGAGWADSGRIAAIMAPLFMVAIVVSPVSNFLVVSGHQRIQFLWETSRFLLIGCCWASMLIIGVDLEEAIAAYIWVAVLSYVVFIYLVDRNSTINDAFESS